MTVDSFTVSLPTLTGVFQGVFPLAGALVPTAGLLFIFSLCNCPKKLVRIIWNILIKLIALRRKYYYMNESSDHIETLLRISLGWGQKLVSLHLISSPNQFIWDCIIIEVCPSSLRSAVLFMITIDGSSASLMLSCHLISNTNTNRIETLFPSVKITTKTDLWGSSSVVKPPRFMLHP